MPLLGSTKKEVKLSIEKLVQIFLSHSLTCNTFVTISQPKAIPIQRTNLPIKDLQFALPPDGVLETVREAVWELGYDIEGVTPAIVVE